MNRFLNSSERDKDVKATAAPVCLLLEVTVAQVASMGPGNYPGLLPAK